MKLSLLTQPKHEIISIAEAKNYLRIDHNFDDALLEMIIKSTRNAMESIIQKSIVTQTWEYAISNSSIGYNIDQDEYPTICYNMIRIPLPKPPIIKILSVKIENKEIDFKKFQLEQVNSIFYASIPSRLIFKSNKKVNITIVYKAGISENIENIPYQLKLANLMLIANAYQERYAYNQNNIISKGVKQLLEPFLNLRIF